MLHNEYQISQPFKTKVHFKLGLPRHTVILTNRRMIVSCKQRFFFFFKHEWETSVLYKYAPQSCVLPVSWTQWSPRLWNAACTIRPLSSCKASSATLGRPKTDV